jgi:hypothetical protein
VFIIFCSTTLISEQLKLVMGPAYLEETVLGLTFHILPTTHFWNSVHTAKMICKGVEELLAPTKKTTVLEVGFGLCLVGLYLSRVRTTRVEICLFTRAVSRLTLGPNQSSVANKAARA